MGTTCGELEEPVLTACAADKALNGRYFEGWTGVAHEKKVQHTHDIVNTWYTGAAQKGNPECNF